MKKWRHGIYKILACSYILSAASLILQRNEILMTFAILLRIMITMYGFKKTKSLVLGTSVAAQFISFLIVFISGSLLMNRQLDLFTIVRYQAITLQISYVLMGIGDALIMLFVAKSTESIFLVKPYYILSMTMVLFVSVGTVGFLTPIPIILEVIVSVFEFTGYLGFITLMLVELIFESKDIYE